MPCCGQNRSRETYERLSFTRGTARMAGRGALDVHVRLHYTGRSAILVRGPITGVPYAFSVDSPEHDVAPSDATGLLRTGLFDRSPA